MLRYVLLGILNYQPLTGYEIKQFMDDSTTYFWHAELSQIYTTLKKLDEEGLLVSELHEQEQRPDRRVYSITPEGRQELIAWLSQPYTRLDPQKETLLVKLFFSARVDKATLLTQIHLSHSLHQNQAERYAGGVRNIIDQVVGHNPALAKDALLWEAILKFGEQYEQPYAHWLEEVKQLVEAIF